MELLVALLAGVMAGLLLWSTAVKIFFGVLAAKRNATLANLFGELTPQKVRKFLFFLFVASCAWASAFAALAVHFLTPNPSGAGWVWFFGGVAATPAFVWVTTLGALRRFNRQAALRVQP